MNSYNIVFQDKALEDAKRIKAYIKYTLLNYKAAEDFTNRLNKQLLRISKNPYIYPTDEFGKYIYRFATIKNYILVFRIDEQTRTVYIIAIGHSLQKRRNIIKSHK